MASNTAISGVAEMQDGDVDEWKITWADGTSRTTTLAGIAFYAREWDDDAVVEPL